MGADLAREIATHEVRDTCCMTMLMHALNYAKRILANAHTEYVDVLLLDVYIYFYSV